MHLNLFLDTYISYTTKENLRARISQAFHIWQRLYFSIFVINPWKIQDNKTNYLHKCHEHATDLVRLLQQAQRLWSLISKEFQRLRCSFGWTQWQTQQHNPHHSAAQVASSPWQGPGYQGHGFHTKVRVLWVAGVPFHDLQVYRRSQPWILIIV